MKILIIIVYFFATSTFVYAYKINFVYTNTQDVNAEKKVQNFLDLMSERSFFQAFDYYETNQLNAIADIDFVGWYYKGFKGSCFNMPDTAIVYLNLILNKYEEQFGFENTWFLRCLKLNYEKLQLYQEAISVCDRLIDYYMQVDSLSNEISWELEVLQKDRIALSCFADKKRIEIDLPDKPVELPMDTPLVIIPVKYNGIELNTIFDTGVSYYLFMTRETADKANVTMLTTNFIEYLNDTVLNVDYGIIDSITIGNIELRNIPVWVYHEHFFSNFPDSVKISKNFQDGVNKLDVFLGLPTMNLLGNICFDFDAQKVIIGKEHLPAQKRNNLLFWNRNLFLNSQINGVEFAAYFDTGDYGREITIGGKFYNRYKNVFNLDTVSVKKPLNYGTMTKLFYNAEYDKIEKLCWEYGGKQYDMGQKSIVQYTENVFITEDGIVGSEFLKRLKKVHFDFKNMVFYPEE